MKFERSAGVLLHPTSLPGPYGIGELGPEAFRWVDFLVETGCRLWQILPLGPTGYGDSPYQCFSAFAGNQFMVSIDLLLMEGLLTPDDLEDMPDFPDKQVDFGAVIPWKLKVLDRAFDNFQKHDTGKLSAEIEEFHSQQADWLDDYALFMALKEAHGGQPWPTWEARLRDRKAKALEEARPQHANAVARQVFRQFLFFRQWKALRSYANEQNVKIIDDIPIFVAHDSAEVWARRDLFFMDSKGNPTVVAGVPPDYFSPTGQLWGNPLYRWQEHASNGYQWWIKRFRAVFDLVDIVRLDHFRGFAGYWEIPAGAETAIKGRWVPGPGKEFFQVIKDALGELPIIAEDLGVITEDVVEMREHFDLPGMKILVFAFDDDASSKFLPHNYIPNCVVYTGTHDNDTTLGWYRRVDEKERDFARRYLARSGVDISWDLIRAAWSSVAVFALTPMQDLLGLDNSARMNYPSRLGGNWAWRMSENDLSAALSERVSEINLVYGRGKPRLAQEKEETQDVQAEEVEGHPD